MYQDKTTVYSGPPLCPLSANFVPIRNVWRSGDPVDAATGVNASCSVFIYMQYRYEYKI